MLTSRLLILNQKEAECKEMAAYFQDSGYSVIWCTEYDEATEILSRGKNKPDLLIFDVDLPKRREYEALEKIRSLSDMAVLMLSQDDKLDSQLYAYSKKIDDYMVKPFAFEELLARIQCMVRRPGRWENTAVLSLGDLIFDPESGRLEGNGKECTLSKREGALLELMLRNAGQTLPREVILNRVWGADSEVEDGNLDNYIHFLRRRLKSVRSTLNLKTVRGIGYRLEN